MQKRRKRGGEKIYASMACMSGNNQCPSGNFGDSSQLTNLILDTRATCLITPEVQSFIQGLLEDTDKNIEVTNRHNVTSKEKVQV